MLADGGNRGAPICFAFWWPVEIKSASNLRGISRQFAVAEIKRTERCQCFDYSKKIVAMAQNVDKRVARQSTLVAIERRALATFCC